MGNILIGIGGTGAKILEAIVHLAESGIITTNLYPIIIDQDTMNGNVRRCKNVIDNYLFIRRILDVNEKQWIFRSVIKKDDTYLPLAPIQGNANFNAAIQLPEINKEEEIAVIKALFSDSQLREYLDYGYKKRAHMGSILIHKMLKNVNENIGLGNYIKNIALSENVSIFIFGSIFGGTGASGITTVGRFVKNLLGESSKVFAVMLTPYFVINSNLSNGVNDGKLVRSDADMQLVKIALEMYKADIEKAFDKIFVLGSSKEFINDDYVTEFPVSGGIKQENPAHIFELIAGFVPLIAEELGNDPYKKFFTFTENTENMVDFPPHAFSELKDYSSKTKIDKKKIDILRIFSKLLLKLKEESSLVYSWKKHQTWVPIGDNETFNTLLNWAYRYDMFWEEMGNKTYYNRSWKKFYYDGSIEYDIFEFARYLGIFIKNDRPTIVDLLKVVNNMYFIL